MLKRIITTWATKRIIKESRLYEAVQYRGNRKQTVYVVVMPTKPAVFLVRKSNIALENAIMFYVACRFYETQNKELEVLLKKIIEGKRPAVIPVAEAMIDEGGGIYGNTKDDKILLGEEI